MPIQKRRQQPMMAAAAAALCSTLLLLVLLGSAGTAEAFARPPAFIPALQQHQQARLRTGPLASPAPFALRGPTAASATRATTTRRMALWWPFGDLFGGSSSSSGAALKKKKVTETHEVVVVGAGVAGLVCAKELAAAGKEVLVLEAADRVGGRVQTDEVGGFLLDRGFQVFIEAYPAVKRQLDYVGLDLQPFWPGALVRAERGFHTVADPFRRPQDLLKGLLAPVGSLGDKVKVGLMRFTLGASASAALLQRPETDTETHLRRTKGFSAQMVDRFFRPFYQGIYLAPLAEQSSRMFDFVFKMFATGGISLPARGIRAVPEQLAAALPQGSVRLGARAKAVAGGRVELADGTVIAADAVVVATEEEAARKLLGERLRKERPKPLGGRGSTCLYYALDGRPPIRDPILILNGEGNGLGEQALNPVRVDGSGVGGGGSAGRVRARAGPPLTPAAGGRKKGASSSTAATRSGSSSSSSVKKAAAPVQPAVRPVNNVVFLNSIAPAYAPPGKSLASVTVVGVPPGNDARLDQAVRAQLAGWFGADTVRAWELLRVYKIPYAQPKQTPPTGADGFARPAAVGEGLFVAGDHRNTATLNGAFESGEKAASAVLAHLGALGAAERVFKGTGAMGMAKTAVAAPAAAAAAPAATKPRSGGPVKAAAVAAASGGDYLATIAGGSGGGSKARARPAPVAGTATRGAISRFRDDLAAEKRRVRKLSGSITARRSLATKSRFREEELKRSGRRGQQPQGGSGGQGPARPAPTAAASGSGSGLPALRSREELVAEAERRMALIDSIMDRPAVPVAAPPKPTTQPAAPVAAKPAPAPTPAPAAAPPAAAPAPPASRPAMSSAGKGSSGGGSRFRQEDRGRRGG